MDSLEGILLLDEPSEIFYIVVRVLDHWFPILCMMRRVFPPYLNSRLAGSAGCVVEHLTQILLIAAQIRNTLNFYRSLNDLEKASKFRDRRKFQRK